MNKNVFGRKLKRDKNERKALFKSLMSSLILYEKIVTSQAKAKAIRPEIEKLITKAKQDENSARRVLEQSLYKPAFDKIIKELGPRFAQRNGGYTRITKIGRRLGDDSKMVLMEWTETASAIVPVNAKQGKAKEVKEQNAEKKEVKKPAKKLAPKKPEDKGKTKKASKKTK